jgi:transmembrane sensor
MSNIYELPNGNQSIDEASLWLARVDRGLSAREEEALKSWLSASEANRATLMKMAKLWDRMDLLAKLADICPVGGSVPARPFRFAWPVTALAASLLLGSVLLTRLLPDTGTQEVAVPVAVTAAANIAADVYETAIGEQATRQLGDGSRIVLNTNSRVSVRYTQGNRLLYLERGEIHVTVAQDKARPLSVLVAGRVVQAVGTEFNIEITGGQRIELMVTEGVVVVGIVDASVENSTGEGNAQAPLVLTQDSTLVAAGQEAVIDAGADPTGPVVTDTIDTEDIAVKLSWREGNLIFRGESLEEAVSEVERYTEVQFIFLDEESKKVRVAGLFKAGDVDGLLAALRENFDISYEWVADDRITLSGP